MRSRRQAVLVFAGGCWLATALPAIYVQLELEQVPLERLLANATERVEAAPDDAFALHTLARIHAMAYAWKLGARDSVETTKSSEDGQRVPSFGFEPPWVPWTRPRSQAMQTPRDGDTTGTTEEARAHLEQAIALYRRTLEHEPDDTIALLGLAWTLREHGDDAEARGLLREVVAEAAPRELERRGRLGPLLAVEAIDYLLPLLDRGRDREEIEELRAQRAQLEAVPRAITPIVVTLRAGLRPEELIDSVHPTRFDLDGSGRALPWPWLDPNAAAWLVWRRERDDAIGSALQLFGSRTFGLFFDDGYQALGLLDDDRDGVLRGAELAGIALWRDLDRDGSSDPGEVVGAADAGVVALGCRASASDGPILGAPGSVELADGRRLDTWDLVLEPIAVPASDSR